MDDDHETGSHDDHDHHPHGEDRPPYDPKNPELPSREPPLRSTAPQSPFTARHVGIGLAVLLVGLFLTFGLAVSLA